MRYEQVKTSEKIILSGNDHYPVSPIATFEDELGNTYQIIKDNRCYVICQQQHDGRYSPTPYIFKEAFEVLRTLKSPTQ